MDWNNGIRWQGSPYKDQDLYNMFRIHVQDFSVNRLMILDIASLSLSFSTEEEWPRVENIV